MSTTLSMHRVWIAASLVASLALSAVVQRFVCGWR